MVETARKYVFDFDSTLSRVEALDVLAEITLKDKSNKNEIIKEIQDITNLGIRNSFRPGICEHLPI